MIRAHRHHFLALAVAALAGCQSHGKYTTAAKANAKQNMAVLRAGTDYDIASQQFHAGDFERALQSIEGSIAENDQVVKSHLLHARVLIELGRTREALDALDVGLQLDPGEAELHYYRGIAHEQSGRREPALEEFLAAAALDQGDPQYRLAASELLVELGRLEEAQSLLEEDGGEFSSHPGFRQALGHVALLRGDLPAALRAFTEAAVLSPDDPVLLEDLCRVQVATGAFPQAEITLARLVSRAEYAGRTDLMRLHASCLLEIGRPVEARRVLLGLTRSPEGAHDPEVWSRLVDVSLMLDDDRMLRSSADRLLATAPDRYEGYLALALWQRREGDLQSALSTVREALSRGGANEAPRKLEGLIQQEILDAGGTPPAPARSR